MSALLRFAKLLGVQPHQAEDALHSESAARAVLSRRNLFAAGAALAAGSVLVGGPLPLHVFTDGCEWYVAHNLDDAYEHREAWNGLTREEDFCELEQLAPRSPISIYIDDKGAIESLDDIGETTTTLTMTAAAWARREGLGFLCTTEH